LLAASSVSSKYVKYASSPPSCRLDIIFDLEMVLIDGSKAMTKYERALLLGLAEEIVLQLRSRLAEIEQLHPRESALGIATFQESLWRIEELLNTVKKDGDHAA
jgi:hypothetical protein